MELYELLGLVSVLPSIAGIAVAAMHLGRTRWAAVLLAGFGIEAAVGLLVRVAAYLVSHQTLGGGNVQLLFAVAGLVGLVGNVAVVVGIAGVLQDLRAAASRATAQAD